MIAHVSLDRSQLTITINDEERAQLGEMLLIDCDDSLTEFLSGLRTNEGDLLEWIRPEWVGDLTDAPMLGVLSCPQVGFGGRYSGSWAAANGVVYDWFEPVIERWGWMSYQVRSLLRELRDGGRAVLVGGEVSFPNASAAGAGRGDTTLTRAN